MAKAVTIVARSNEGNGKFPQLPMEFNKRGHAKPVPNALYSFRIQVDRKRRRFRPESLEEILNKRANSGSSNARFGSRSKLIKDIAVPGL